MLTPAQRTEIKEIAAEIANEIKRQLGLSTNLDMEYAASLPPAQRKIYLKERTK